ncbi:Methyltransferase type 12 [Corchorus capsularis]|uniref:tRNA N(3)-methylcytidine methyltransferase n=1 Tax=Corchorus capsularis TaxID=210143 RepID=A0A1R3HK53_COCAP|nr:Methyltransferase type 12 [Corchorus capsularis]
MRALTVGIAFAGSYCRLTPSMYLISTAHQCHRYFSSTAIEAARRYPNLDEYYQKNACKFWDNFYKRHKNKFFKDRHYLEKDWGQYFSDDAHSSNGKVVLEVGCGAGNTIFPLVAAYPKVFVHACDISPHAIALVKSHMEFKEDRVNAFVYDVTVNNLLKRINPSSVDVITLETYLYALPVKGNAYIKTNIVKQIFVLSAVSPYKMPLILQNIKRPGGHVLLRDYAVGDFAQVKLNNKNQMISEGFYVRGDGTCSFYFSEDFLSTLFLQAGFNTVDISTYCKQIKNHRRNVTMDRRWIRAVFNLG